MSFYQRFKKKPNNFVIYLLWCVSVATRDIFISRKSSKIYKNIVKIPKCMLSFTLYSAVPWARLESSAGLRPHV